MHKAGEGTYLGTGHPAQRPFLEPIDLSGAYRPSRETHINSVRYHRVSMAGRKEGGLLLFLICSFIRSLSNNFPSLTTASTLGIQYKRRKREGQKNGLRAERLGLSSPWLCDLGQVP